MSYQVTGPLAIISPADAAETDNGGNAGPRYFYQGAVIPSGFNDKRCEELVEEGMLAVADDAGSDSGPTTKDEILEVVGSDKDLAQQYLDQENAANKPRKTLVEALQAVLDKD